jgi:hypothetical protein
MRETYFQYPCYRNYCFELNYRHLLCRKSLLAPKTILAIQRTLRCKLQLDYMCCSSCQKLGLEQLCKYPTFSSETRIEGVRPKLKKARKNYNGGE